MTAVWRSQKKDLHHDDINSRVDLQGTMIIRSNSDRVFKSTNEGWDPSWLATENRARVQWFLQLLFDMWLTITWNKREKSNQP